MATVTKTSTGFVDGVWSTATNWTPGVAPISGDEAIIYDTATNIAGEDQNAVVLDQLIFQPSYSGQVGSDGDPLLIDATDFWWNGTSSANFVDGAYTRLYVNTENMSATAFVLNKTNTHTVGTTAVTGGRLTVGTVCTATLLGMMGIDSRIYVDALTSSTVTTLDHINGTFESNAAVTTHNQSGGTTVHEAGTATTVNLYDGTYRFNGGTVTTLNQYGGVFDMTQGTGVTRTLTTHNRWGGELWRSGKLNLAADIAQRTFGIGFDDPQGNLQTIS